MDISREEKPREVFDKIKQALGDQLSCSIESSPKGNREWKIDVSLSSLRLPPRPALSPESPLSGSVACHRVGDFTTYAVSVLGDEVWFDQLDPAVDLLASSLKE